MKFNEIRLIEPILKALEEEGYEEPTPIQEKTIPHILEGKDILGCAQTGTGKTAAFAIPILQNLTRTSFRDFSSRKVRCLILSPTRELAIQIGESFDAYGRHLKLKNTIIFGGVSQVPQIEKLKKGIDVLVATPGRLLDLYNQGCIDLSNIEIFVLDEADRMLSMGFIHDVKRIIQKIPTKRQTLLFSATMPQEIDELAKSILIKPQEVKVNPVSSTAEKIVQGVYFVEKANKKLLLRDILSNKEIKRMLVFTRTKHGANKVVKELGQVGIKADAIHGNKSQTARQNALENFKNNQIRVLVATDIAARGIDISELEYVLNYDLPNVAETYVHRIGRSGRAGAEGYAISFCDTEERAYLKDIQKLIKMEIKVLGDFKSDSQTNSVDPNSIPSYPKNLQVSKNSNQTSQRSNQTPNKPLDSSTNAAIPKKKKKRWFGKKNQLA